MLACKRVGTQIGTGSCSGLRRNVLGGCLQASKSFCMVVPGGLGKAIFVTLNHSRLPSIGLQC